jgi:hypothetical protein
VEVPLESLDPARKRIPFEVSDVAGADVRRVANGKDTGKAEIDGNDHHINVPKSYCMPVPPTQPVLLWP